MTRPDLIKQLQSLSPTEGEWTSNQYNHITGGRMFIGEILSGDDCELTTLAPTMRTEILAMAKEIKELRSQLSLAHELIKTQPK